MFISKDYLFCVYGTLNQFEINFSENLSLMVFAVINCKLTTNYSVNVSLNVDSKEQIFYYFRRKTFIMVSVFNGSRFLSNCPQYRRKKVERNRATIGCN